MKSDHLPSHVALLLFAVVVLAWGFNWPVTKLIVHSISPLWTATFRSLIAAVVLLGLLSGQGNLIVPRRGRRLVRLRPVRDQLATVHGRLERQVGRRLDRGYARRRLEAVGVGRQAALLLE